MSDTPERSAEALLLDRFGGVLVADKPAGLASTGRTLQDPDCLQFVLQHALRRRKLWAIHQLDRQTSGLNLFATHKAAVARWSGRLQEGSKLYVAFAHGEVPPGPIEVQVPLGRKRREDGRSVPAVLEDGKPARTTVRGLDIATSEAGTYSLVLARIHTGRTHQVRLHLAHLGHPLVGEALHRTPPCALHSRHALHAWRLDLPARAGDRRLAWEAPLPEDLVTLASTLGLDLGALESEGPLPAGPRGDR